ncbi:MAG: hypothetical protein ACI841_004148 [Planctomycetota bacterium]|jgi:hypothetical protein
MKTGILTFTLATLLIIPLQSCRTLIFSKRQHQPHSSRFDPNILILDGLGLLFFVVPGLVFFGVDLYTGAIFLPDDVERGEGPFIQDKRDKKVEEKVPESTSAD